MQLKVTTANKPGILANVSQTFSAQKINISEANCRASDDGRACNIFTFHVADLVAAQERDEGADEGHRRGRRGTGVITRRTLLAGLAATAGGCYAPLKPPPPIPYGVTPDADLRMRFDDRMRPYLAKNPSASVVVGVVERDKMRALGYGRTAYHDPERPTADTVFELGTLSQVFTAVLLAALVERGRVKYEDRVDDKTTLSDLAIAQREAHSDQGFGRLGQLLAAHEGHDLGALYDELVLGNLGMKSTGTFERTQQLESRFAEGFDAVGRRLVPLFQLSPLAGCCGLRASTNDLMRFAHAAVAIDSSPLAKALEASLQSHRVLDDGSELALGWLVNRRRGVIWKAGEMPGFRSALLLHGGRALTLLVADARVDVAPLAFELLRELEMPPTPVLPAMRPVVKALPEGTTPAQLEFERVVRLVGHSVAQTGDDVRVTLYWTALTRIKRDWEVTVEVEDTPGHVRTRLDHYPAEGRMPMWEWQPGEIVVDTFSWHVPKTWTAGKVQLWIGLGSGGQRMRAPPGPAADIAGRGMGPAIGIQR